MESLALPQVGDNGLSILSSRILELVMINTKDPAPASVTNWNLVTTNYQFLPPAPSAFQVTVGGVNVPVQAVLGFKRRPLYAPLLTRDLRIHNALYLQLSTTIADGQIVEVTNPSGSLWPATMRFAATNDPLRASPVIHVNQEGYRPSFPKKAMVGYYLGNAGEMDIPTTQGFKLIEDATGAQVFTGALVLRPDAGYTYTPRPYQKVYVADFSAFTTPGVYRLMVPGLGVSSAFRIDEAIMMTFTRNYALGLYHQRCGTNNILPFTRFTHGLCHTNLVEVPIPQSSFTFTWNKIASYSADYTNNSRHTAPQLKDVASQRYPFVRTGTIEVSGGHHDSGDYSKYTINSAALVHYLMFAVDALPGVAALDNLGLPESGDGVSDLLQEAKWEADFLAKMQDADGGFYFLVYPKTREYESNVLPDAGDAQVVWPKTTAVTAAAVAALAQCASSPYFKQQYPTEASNYLQKAQLGWDFLTNAIARYGKDGSYQKITHYGDVFMHDDELAWAACEMYLATGQTNYQQKLLSWFPNPSDSATWRWSWWRMFGSYGCAIRSYAFATRTGRLATNQLDSTYLARCQAEIRGAAQNALTRYQSNAYGTSFPLESKTYRQAGWYFSNERAFDLTVGYQLDPRPEYLEAMLGNLNYEAGCNPVNVCFMTGLGVKRQREMVHQYALNDRRVLPPSGFELGNIQNGFTWVATYGSELHALCFPSDYATTAPYPFYDRWADAYNVETEFVTTDLARSLADLAFLASLSATSTQAWTLASGQIVLPAEVLTGAVATAVFQAPGVDLAGSRIVWEAQKQEPAFGPAFSFVPTQSGTNWIEVEAQLTDGRRLFAVTNFVATNRPPVVAITNPTTRTVFLPNTNTILVLEASVADTAPFGALQTAWSKISGPGQATFGESLATNTTVRFSANGVYRIRLTAQDGSYSAFDEIAVVIDPENRLGAGCIGWWRCDELSGNMAYDYSGSYRNATISGARWFAGGKIGAALDFDGTNNAASFPSPALTQYTVSAWVQSDGDGNSASPRIVEMPGVNLRIRRDSVGGHSVAFMANRTTTSPEWRTPLRSFLDGSWFHLTAVFNSSNLANVPLLYINGSNQVLTTIATTAGSQVSNAGQGYLGNRSALDRGFNGRIDEVRIYNRLLSPDEVQLLLYGQASNRAPQVDAGTAQSTTNAATFNLQGAASDDGQPNALRTTWSQLSGPGWVFFANANALNTSATFSEPGTYTLRLTATDGQVSVCDDLTVTIGASMVSVVAIQPIAFAVGPESGVFELTRSGDVSQALSITFNIGGTATKDVDYTFWPATNTARLTFAAGVRQTWLVVLPTVNTNITPAKTVSITLTPSAGYLVEEPSSAVVTIAGNCGAISSVRPVSSGTTLTWATTAGRVYQVLYKDDFLQPGWNSFGAELSATGSSLSWTDPTLPRPPRRFYRIIQVR